MDVRHFVLRASLTCLGLTAASAIVLLFAPFGGFASNLTFTGLIASVAGALSWPFTAWATREDTRWGGLAGVVFICAELLLSLILLWGARSGLVNDELIGGTMIDLVIVVVPCVLGARMLGKSGRDLVGVVALGAGTLALIILLIDTWKDGGVFGPRTESELRFHGITLAVAGGAAALGLVRPRERIRWPLAALILAVAGAALIFVWVETRVHSWALGRHGPDQAEIGIALLVLAYGIGLANVVLLPKLTQLGRWVQYATAASSMLTAALAACAILFNDDALWTMVAASAIALFCGVSAILIMRRFMQEPVLALDRALLSTIEVTCPRCKRRGPVGLGKSECSKCGLRFKIEVEEPRCSQCGQLLYGIESDRCPECGNLIANAAIS